MADDIPTENIVEAIMKDPLKRDMLLKFLNKEKSGFKAYKDKEAKLRPTTPVQKNRFLHCESPTALLRRRALEKDTASDSSSSEQSEPKIVAVGPKLPFKELLKGVRAYVEIIRHGVDKSAGIKTVMELMGATIRDIFTKDITHVVFKDGSFSTFQKAKLLKVHLVSVLWVDAVRKSESRVPEKNYPAFGSKVSDEHVSALCSQLSREFEDVVLDEKRRTMSSVNDIDKNRRRTTFIPPSQIRTSSSIVNVQNDKVLYDANDSDSIASDDSDRVMIDGEVSKRPFTSSFIDDSLNERTGVSPSLSFNGLEKNSRKSSIISNKEISDMDLTGNVSTTIETPTSIKKSCAYAKQHLENSPSIISIESTSESTQSGLVSIGNPTSADIEKTNNVSTHTVMSSLRLSTESDQTKSGLASRRNTRTSKSTLGTTMSSLQLVDSVEDKENSVGSPLEKTDIDSAKQITNSSKSIRRKTIANLSSPTKNTPSKRKPLTGSATSSLNDSSNSSDDLDTVKKRRTTSFVRKNRKSCKRNIANDPDFQESSNSDKLDTVDDLSNQLDAHNKSASDQSSSKSDKSIFKTPLKTLPKTPRSALSNSRPRRSCTISSQEEEEPKTPRRQSLRVGRNSTKKSDSIAKNSEEPIVRLKKLETDLSKKSAAEKSQSTIQDSQTEVKSRRKLYNPDEMTFLQLSQDDNQQRQARRQQKITERQVPFVQISKDQQKVVDKLIKKNNSTISGYTKQKTDENKNGKSAEEQSDESDSDSFRIPSTPNTRRSRRLSVLQTNSRDVTSSSSSDTSSILLPKPLPNRRSTLDFMSLTQTQQKRRLKLDPNRKTSVTCTRLHRKEVDNFEKTVRELGKLYIEDTVTAHTSHLVAGEPKRTINMLRGIARGCWIVSYKWLLKSQELNRWQPEEDYEMTDFSSAVQKCRIQRQAFGSTFTIDIFKDCGCIYVGKNTSPKNEELRELITLCQGTLSNVYRNADIIIGELMNGSDFVCLQEKWVLDSIMLNKLQSYKNYYLKVPAGNSPSY